MPAKHISLNQVSTDRIGVCLICPEDKSETLTQKEIEQLISAWETDSVGNKIEYVITPGGFHLYYFIDKFDDSKPGYFFAHGWVTCLKRGN